MKQELLYYVGANGTNESFEKRASGAYIFRPSPDFANAVPFASKVNITTYRGILSDEIHQEFSPWAKQVIRVLHNANIVVFDWLIGPIDVSDGYGKEVIFRFTTDLNSGDTFYTDSNGREMLKRIRNYRPTYNYTNEEPVAGNYYPITSKIVIKDEAQNVEFALLNDRAQGGSSLASGQVELMLHRRLLNDDAFGVGEALNEEQFGEGLMARGRVIVTFGSIVNQGGRSSAAEQRLLAQEFLHQPLAFVTGGLQQTNNTQFSGLTRPLPDNVQILTLESWNVQNNQVLLRLEHILETGEDPVLSQVATVNLIVS